MKRAYTVILAATVVAGLGWLALEGSSSAPAGATLGASNAADGAGLDGPLLIEEGDLIQADYVIFLEGQPWKTSYAWVGKLLIDSGVYGDDVEYNASAFRPTTLTAGQTVHNNPLLTAVAAELPGLAYGQHAEFDLVEPYGSRDDIEIVELPRAYGPYPAETTWDELEFRERFGQPFVGQEVQTNRLVNSTVVEVTPGKVVTRSNAEDGTTIALPTFNSFLQVKRQGDEVSFVLDPVEDVSFQVHEARPYFGLAPGHYLVTDVTDSTITYEHHPSYSPPLVGLTFHVAVDILPEPVDGLDPIVVEPAHGHGDQHDTKE